MSGVDALLALRESCMQQRATLWSDDRQKIQINGVWYPRSTLTPYRARGKGAFFQLDALAVFLEDANKNEKHSAYAYLNECKKQGVQAVSMTQRKEMLEYLRGTVDSSPAIDAAGFEKETGAAAAANTEEGDSKEEADERSGKRQRIGDGAPHVKPVSEWTVEDIIAEEQPLYTHLSMLQLPTKSVGHILDLYQKAASDRVKVESSSSRSSRSGSKRDRAVKSEQQRPSAPMPGPSGPNAGIPIIVVPAALSSVINMYNAQQLLQNGVFVPSEDIRKETGGRKPTFHSIPHASYYDPSKDVPFHVIDDVSSLRGADWDRVVGVFVSGPAWQFAEWPKSRWANPAAIFDSVCAFHLHFDDEALAQNITQWRTHRLPISKTKRHGDRGVVLDFWRILTEFVAARNNARRLAI